MISYDDIISFPKNKMILYVVFIISLFPSLYALSKSDGPIF